MNYREALEILNNCSCECDRENCDKCAEAYDVLNELIKRADVIKNIISIIHSTNIYYTEDRAEAFEDILSLLKAENILK